MRKPTLKVIAVHISDFVFWWYIKIAVNNVHFFISNTIKLQYLKFTLWKDEFIVDTVKLSEETKEEECIAAETATSMMCHQPNMEFVRSLLSISEWSVILLVMFYTHWNYVFSIGTAQSSNYSITGAKYTRILSIPILTWIVHSLDMYTEGPKM